MKENQNGSQEIIKIPGDVLIDILALIVRERIKHEVCEVIENRSLVMIALTPEQSNPRHQKALKNISQILEYYHEHRTEESEDLDWKED